MYLLGEKSKVPIFFMGFLVFMSLFFVKEPIVTQDAALNAADVSWMLTSSALVLIMTPGLAFFYGGMVKKKM